MTSESKIANDAKAIDGAGREALWLLFQRGPLRTIALSGSLIGGREWLIREGYAEFIQAAPQGWVFLTRAGVNLALTLSLGLRKARAGA